VNGGFAFDGRGGTDPQFRLGYGFRVDALIGRGETQPLFLMRPFGWGVGPYGEFARNGLHDNIWGGGLTLLSPGISGQNPERLAVSLGLHATEAGDRPYSHGISGSLFFGVPGLLGVRAGYRHGLGDLREDSVYFAAETNALAVVAVPLAIVALPFIIAICASSRSGCMPGGFVSWGPPAPVAMREGALARLRRAAGRGAVGSDLPLAPLPRARKDDAARARRPKAVRTASRVAGLVA
jgi:hypothetical protein